MGRVLDTFLNRVFRVGLTEKGRCEQSPEECRHSDPGGEESRQRDSVVQCQEAGCAGHV